MNKKIGKILKIRIQHPVYFNIKNLPFRHKKYSWHLSRDNFLLPNVQLGSNSANCVLCKNSILCQEIY